MFKRYFKTILLLLLLLFAYGLCLLPIILVQPNLHTGQYLLALLGWLVVVVASFLPLLGMIIRKVWFFPGNGEPILMELLQEKILAINEMDAPLQVKKKRKGLAVCWRHDDPAWCEKMDAAGMKNTFELRLDFDNSTKTVNLSDRIRSVDFDLCPVKVKTSLFALPQPFFRISTGSQWNVEVYRERKISDYSFHPREIKSPVMGTILENGWNVRFNLF